MTASSYLLGFSIDRCADAFNDVLTIWDGPFKSTRNHFLQKHRKCLLWHSLLLKSTEIFTAKAPYSVAHDWASINRLLIRCFTAILSILFIYFFCTNVRFFSAVRTPNSLIRENKKNLIRIGTSPRSMGSCISIDATLAQKQRRKKRSLAAVAAATCIWRLKNNNITIRSKLYVWICNFR